MRSGASLWNRLVLCADLYEFLADIRSDRLSELQLSLVLSLNDEELTQKPEEILVSTSELTGFMELSTALGSCRPIGACTFPTGIGNSSAVPPHELFHSILLCSLTDRVCQNPTKLLSNTGAVQTQCLAVKALPEPPLHFGEMAGLLVVTCIV